MAKKRLKELLVISFRPVAGAELSYEGYISKYAFKKRFDALTCTDGTRDITKMSIPIMDNIEVSGNED